MTDATLDLMFLGTGYPLFFAFVTDCINLLIIIFLTTGGYNLASNILLGNYCNLDDNGVANVADAW